MPSKWMNTLSKLDGAIDREYDWFASENVLRTGSPSVNWIFPKSFGIPFGQSAIFYSEPKAGKSLLSNLFIANLHQTNPDAEVIYFNTEYRSVQLEEGWGIDPDRIMVYNVSDPTKIFDRICNEILNAVQSGMPLKLIVIDSLQGIQGVKEMSKESIANHLIGDHSLTIGAGLKKILPIIRENKIALICTSHVRSNIGGGPYGPDTKMGGGWAQKHYFESFISLKRAGAADDKKDITGQSFESEVKDFRGKKDITGHKIFIKMEENSLGTSGRSGQVTIDYNKGLINVHEEIFELSKNLNIVERPNNRTYIFDGVSYSSKMDFANAIRDNEELREKLLKEIYK